MTFGVAQDPKDAANKVLRLYKDTDDKAVTYQSNLFVTPETKAADYNTFVFEADFYVDYLDTAADKVFELDFCKGGNTNYATRILIGASNGKMSYRLHTANTIPETSVNYNVYTESAVAAENAWYTIRVEYKILDAAAGKTQTLIYVNDALVVDADYVQNATVYTDVDYALIQTWSSTMMDFYMDNVICEKIKVEAAE